MAMVRRLRYVGVLGVREIRGRGQGGCFVGKFNCVAVKSFAQYACTYVEEHLDPLGTRVKHYRIPRLSSLGDRIFFREFSFTNIRIV